MRDGVRERRVRLACESIPAENLLAVAIGTLLMVQRRARGGKARNRLALLAAAECIMRLAQLFDL